MRNAIRRALTKTVRVEKREIQLPPSEKLVYGVYFAIVALICLTALEAVYMIMLRSFSSEIFAAITLIIGTILGVFFQTGS